MRRDRIRLAQRFSIRRARNRRGNAVALVAAAGVAAALTTARAPAQQMLGVWDGGNGTGIWSDPFNWEGDITPNNGASTWHVIISANGNQFPLMNMNVTIDRLSILPTNGLLIDNGMTLGIVGVITGNPDVGAIGNEGVITMQGAANNTDLIIMGNDGLLLDNGSGLPGLLTLSASSTNRIYGLNGDEILFVGNSQRIEGAGQLGRNLMRLDNHGQIVAIHPGVPLTIDSVDALVTNFGLFAAEGGGTLQLTAATYVNAGGGVILANVGSSIELLAATIEDSTLITNGDGRIVAAANTATLRNVTLNGILEVPNNLGPRAQDALVNQGSINLQSTANNTHLYIDNNLTTGVQLSGAGVINMSESFFNRIGGWNGNETFENVDNTIRGSGQVGVNNLAITNHAAGSIIADQPAAGLAIDPGPGGMINDGLIRAANGATLILQPGDYDNTNGVIEAQLDSVIELNAAAITGGLLDSIGLPGPPGPPAPNGPAPGLFVVTGNTTSFQDIVLDGQLDIPNVLSPRFIDSIENVGVINLLSTANNTNFYVDNDATGGVQLSGGGTINLSNSFFNRITGWNANETLTNLNNTIRGSGQFGVNGLTIFNDGPGSIIADQPARLEIDPGAGGMTNLGLLRAESGGTLRLGPATYDNTGGTIDVLDGSTLEFFAADVDFGGGPLNVSGPGTVHLDGAFALRHVSISADPGSFFFATGASGTIEDAAFDSVLEIQNNASVRFQDDIVNTGQVALASTGNNTNLYVDANLTGGLQFSGGGTIALGNNFANRILGWVAGTPLTNIDNTIRGSGQLGVNSISIDNQSSGFIIADQPVALQVDPDGNGLVNAGTMRADAGGTLRLLTGGVYENAGGVIESVNGSLVELSATHVRNGVIQSDGSSIVRVVGNTAAFEALTLGANLEVPNNISPRFLDGIVNTGDISVESTGSNTTLYIDNNVTGGVQLTGGGTIHLGDSFTNRIAAWQNVESLTNVDNTIRGSGQFGINSLTIINQGTIAADQPTDLEIDPNAGGFTNDGGTLRAESGSTLRSNDPILQTSGVTDVRGTLDLLGTNLLDLDGGILTGAGVVIGPVDNDGAFVRPGNSAGELTLDGDYVQTAAGTLDVEIGGPLPFADHDVLTVLGDAVISGTLRVGFLDDYVPPPGTAFVVLSAHSVTGVFDQVLGPGDFNIIYGQRVVWVVVNDVTPTCVGDFNFSGAVEIGDLLLLLSGWGTDNPALDIAPAGGDGIIDIADLLALLAAWGDC